MTTPFRERPWLLMCPRCGDVLERILQGVLTCTRCEGVWLANATIDKAFGSQRWPFGASAWWRRALECPACACEGAANAMTPMLVDNFVVDRCATHGVWLDHGELGRLIGAPNVVELEAFHERLKPGAELPPALLEQRKRREVEHSRRQHELEEYRKRLAAERERLEAENRAEQARMAAERARIVTEKLLEETRIAAEQRAAERKRLAALRAAGEREVDAKEKELVRLREQVRAAEGKLFDARAQLLELDRQLEALGRG